MFKDVDIIIAAILFLKSRNLGIAMTQDIIIPHAYTVELRFEGSNLEPSEITKRLNLEPSNAFSKTNSNSVYRKRRPYWAYNGQHEGGFNQEWTCLEDGLAFLNNILWSRKSLIISLASEYEGVWWCGHFQSSFDGGPTLSPKLLIEIGSYQIPLSIDNYFG